VVKAGDSAEGSSQRKTAKAKKKRMEFLRKQKQKSENIMRLEKERIVVLERMLNDELQTSGGVGEDEEEAEDGEIAAQSREEHEQREMVDKVEVAVEQNNGVPNVIHEDEDEEMFQQWIREVDEDRIRGEYTGGMHR